MYHNLYCIFSPVLLIYNSAASKANVQIIEKFCLYDTMTMLFIQQKLKLAYGVVSFPFI